MLDELNFGVSQNKLFAAFDAPSSGSAVLTERATLESVTQNRIVIEDSALPYLVGERKMLAEEAARIMLREAGRFGIDGEIRISKVTPSGIDSLQYCLDVQQKITATGKRAEDYFEYMNNFFTSWADSLPEEKNKILDDDILIGVDWNMDAPDE